MKVAGITSGGDWIFGRGKASYKNQSSAIRQNLLTRLRSFKNDWFLDVDNGTDWIDIFGSRNNRSRITNAVVEVVLSTEGVRSLDSINITNKNSREINISFTYTDVYDLQFIINESVQA
jgi:hypothetical protein